MGSGFPGIQARVFRDKAVDQRRVAAALHYFEGVRKPVLEDNRLVHIVGAEQVVGAASHISHVEDRVAQDLALYAERPLMRGRRLHIGVDHRLGVGRERGRLGQAAWLHVRRRQSRKVAQPAAGLSVVCVVDGYRATRQIRENLRGQQECADAIEGHAIVGADRRLPVAERVPGESGGGSEIG